MKKNVLFSILICIFVFSLPSCCRKSTEDYTHQSNTSCQTTENTSSQTEPTSDIEKKRTVTNYENMKAIWLSQFDLFEVYTANNKQRDESEYRILIQNIMHNIIQNGFNTVIVQVRPYADSFCPSNYYPPSRFVTGSYSVDFLYDPISILIEEAHKIGLSVQGWINPLRAMNTKEIKEVNEKYLIKQWYNDSTKYGTYLVEYNGRYYLNPAYNEVRELIINGVYELLGNYSFDGIHMDDYFYPTDSESFDIQAYQMYCITSGTISLKQFRYDMLNKLVSGIYDAVKTQDKKLIFGISPEGNIINVTEKAFADVYTWCSEEGYIDYICPQIYFGFEHQTHPFNTVCDQWQSIVKNDDIKFMIGMTLGKAYSKTDQWAGSGNNEWANNNDILKRCLEYTAELKKCSGVSYFCYQYFYDPITSSEITETAAEKQNLIPLLKDISWN